MSRDVTYENVKYGMLVEVLNENSSGYHAGCKVHFFNRKGVLVGNLYEFLPYSRLRLREPYKGKTRTYQRFFFQQRLEPLKRIVFMPVIWLTSVLIRFTQRHMD